MKKIIVPLVLCLCCLGVGLAFLSTHEGGYYRFGYVRPASLGTFNVGSTTPATMLMVGDIMLGRGVETLMDQYGPDYPFQNIDSLLEQPDLVVANLEGPIMADHTQTPNLSFTFSFSPTVAPLLAKHHVGLVSLANNHTFNGGAVGYDDTIKFLSESGVDYVGHPLKVVPGSLFRSTVGDQNVDIFAFNFTDPSFSTSTALNFIKSNLTKGHFTIVFMHGGTEYALHSNNAQETFYRSILDAGADVVVGAHPHVVEDIEEYKGKIIFYSLGNFIFDQYFSQDVQQELALSMTISDTDVRYNLIPIISTKSQPALMDDADKDAWLQRLAARSDPFLATSIASGTIEVARLQGSDQSSPQ